MKNNTKGGLFHEGGLKSSSKEIFLNDLKPVLDQVNNILDAYSVRNTYIRILVRNPAGSAQHTKLVNIFCNKKDLLDIYVTKNNEFNNVVLKVVNDVCIEDLRDILNKIINK